jgi:hypothetical protein
MELNPKLYCPHCGVEVLINSAFCHACGRAVADMKPDVSPDASLAFAEEPVNAHVSSTPLLPEFRGLRAINWIIVALLVPGAGLMLLRSSTPTGVLLVALLMAFLVGTFLITAVTLSRDTAYFAGLPTGAYRSTMRKVSLVGNVVMLFFGLAGVIACLTTQQFGPLLGMLVYAIPPGLNLRALRALAPHTH